MLQLNHSKQMINTDLHVDARVRRTPVSVRGLQDARNPTSLLAKAPHRLAAPQTPAQAQALQVRSVHRAHLLVPLQWRPITFRHMVRERDIAIHDRDQ